MVLQQNFRPSAQNLDFLRATFSGRLDDSYYNISSSNRFFVEAKVRRKLSAKIYYDCKFTKFQDLSIILKHLIILLLII